jgi:hypothetical protein
VTFTVHSVVHVAPTCNRRFRDAEEAARPIREALAAWAAARIEALRDARPDIPDELDDRAADGWEPLLAIADAAGRDWPTRARSAALALSLGDSREDDSLGVRLLADIRDIFEERRADRLATAELVAALNALEEAPWGDLRGRPLDGRRLARLLRPFGIAPNVIRLPDGTVVRGYDRVRFMDEWGRYLSPSSPERALQALQALQAADSDSARVTLVTPNTDMEKDVHEAAAGALEASPQVAPVARGRECRRLGLHSILCKNATWWWGDDGSGPTCRACHPPPVPEAAAFRCALCGAPAVEVVDDLPVCAGAVLPKPAPPPTPVSPPEDDDGPVRCSICGQVIPGARRIPGTEARCGKCPGLVRRVVMDRKQDRSKED